MKLLHGIKLREEVQLAGIPIVWRTNLSNEDIRSVYLKLEADPNLASVIARNEGTQMKGAGVGISFSIFNSAIDFKDGHCECFGLLGNLWLIYRTTAEWELLEARESEIQELREEQRQERKAEQLVYTTEDNFLSDKMAGCLNDKNYSDAVRFLCLRLELRKQDPRIKKRVVTPGSLMREAIKIFCYFPKADDGIQFILEHFPWSWALFDFAKNYWASSVLDRQSKLLEMDKIFGAVNEHFQTDARINKKVCLFWEKEGELERAIQYCKICASRNLKDGTANGFSGRLERLGKKIKRGTK